ncbi:PREDICTED: CCR4-NOT transcription complex subunit 3-like isoform X2 [Acropora digitifera]|uniref:CCR4-NOT transcription complex subunit 3-like isoform X2 n=1 Tax=Acropora digitifera TaxID=70779 RepID=UPI00077A8CB4|nr:PREDICTED: CCR4-NOT transcription complex subunit 3-like isoform X2 [Acropora digitifera]
MADKRKLQGEIDRCLKKVTEGVETFDDIWQKVHNATNANQKEKYEADLKKEIKKLQRLRDQIKTWMASNDIKDKRILQETRKLIETQMERFKVVERETKTKAYSKEGLGLAAKVDPATKEREEARIWITEVLDRLQIEVDHIESEVEQVHAGSRKKKLDRDKQDKVDELQDWATKHRYHSKQWEMILRMLDNCTIQPDEIKKLQEDMDFYLDCYKEPDFQENDYMYDDFDLEADIASLNTLATSPTDDDGDVILNHVPLSPSSSIPPNSPGTPGTPTTPGTPGGVNSKITLNSPRKNSKNGPTHGNSFSSSSPPRTPFKTANNAQPSFTPTTSATAPAPVVIKASNVTSKVVNSMIHTNENHESSNGEEPVQKTVPLSTPPPPVSGYAVAAGAQQNHVDGGPVSPPSSTAPPRMANHVSSVAPSIPSSLSRPVLIAGNGMDQSIQNNHLPETETAKSSMPEFVSSMASMSITTPPTILTAPTVSQGNSVPQPSPVLSSVLGVKSSTTSVAPASSQSVSTSMTSSLPSNSVPSSAQGPDIGGFTLSMASPHVSNSGPVLSNSTMSVEDSLVSSSNQTTSILSGSHLMSNPGQTQQPSTSNSFSSLKSIAAQAVATAGLSNPVPVPTDYSSESRGLLDSSSNQTTDESKAVQETNTAHLQPLLGVAPLGPVPLNKERCYQLAMLEAAYHHLPLPADSEKVRPFLPRSPYPTPAYHHQHPPQHVDSIEFFQRLSTETLFFIFYYQEGTRAQYLAAKALKKQSWRFHTRYMMWFQRHEEPKAITDEYEQGTYIYFDYEKWSQRKKEGFTFEYRYLEDKELP